MKNIFKNFSSNNLKEKMKEISNRFPISIITIFLITILLFINLHYNRQINDILNIKTITAILAMIIVFIFSIGIYLFAENSKKSKFKKRIFQLIPIIFGIVFYNISPSNMDSLENMLFFILGFSGVFSLLFFAPYIQSIFVKGIKQSIFYTYFYNISIVVLISSIFALVLFGFGAIGIATIDTLFLLDISISLTYGNWAIISLALITPLFFLTQIPSKESFNENHFNENSFFSFLIKFIAIPFIYLYFFILYIYSIKVLSNFQQWPRGEVSGLVIGFSIFGYLIYIFSYIFEEKNILIKSFRKIFPFAVIPQIFMLFYAIYLRINQYDITINRYFIIVLGLLLFIISIYFIFSKKKSLIAIPALLTLFIIIISVIPKYNVYTFSHDRQLTRLKNNLKKAKILQGNNIVPLKQYSDISRKLSKDIYSGIDHLCDFNSCKSIKELFPKIYSEIKNKKSDLKNKWTIISGISKKIKVERYHHNFGNSVIYSNKEDFFPLDIRGYSKIYRIGDYNIGNKDYVKFNYKKQEIIILENSKKIKSISLTKINKELIKKFGKRNRKLSEDNLTFKFEGGKYKLYVERIDIPSPDYKGDNIYGYRLKGYLLIK